MNDTMKNAVELAKKAKNAQEVADAENKASKIERTIQAIKRKVIDRAEGFLKNFTPDLSNDLDDFLKEGCDEQLLQGVGVYFGSIGNGEYVKKKDYGPYAFSLEKGLPNAHYPWVFKVYVSAPKKLAKFLGSRLRLDEDVNIKVANTILMGVYTTKVGIRFLKFNEFKNEIGSAEPIIVAREMAIIGKSTAIEIQVLAYSSDGMIIITKTSWWDENQLPNPSILEFDLKYLKQD